MSVNTSISPYYDDYNIDKNFYRVLFKPGVAVQARELTQSQTILQNQIKRVGDYLFTNGDKVQGSKPIINTLARTIRLKETDAAGNNIDVTRFVGMFVTSPNSDVVGEVEFAFRKDDPRIGDPPSIVINLKRHSNDNNGEFAQNTELWFYSSLSNAFNKASPELRAVTTFDFVKQGFCQISPFSKRIILRTDNENIEVGDLLEHPLITKRLYVVEKISTTELEINEAPGVTISSVTEGGDRVQFNKKASSPTLTVTQDTSVYFKDGFFIRSVLQRIVPDKETAYPTKVVGFFTEEKTINSNDDTTLLDPALGSSNYFAPGADRLQIDLEIVALDLEDVITDNTTEQTADSLLFEDDYIAKKLTSSEDFIPLVKFNKGKIEYIREVTVGSQLKTALAERTYDESGNYVVENFSITSSENLGYPNSISFNVGAGKGYIGGNLVKTVGATEVITPKNLATDIAISYNVNTTQGNYVKVKNIQYGLFRQDEIISSETFVELHNVKNPTSANSRVGVLTLKSLEYDSYTGGNVECKLYYHYYAPASDVPTSWAGWATRYNIPESEGRYLSNVLYESNAPILTVATADGTVDVPAGTYYGLFREPDAGKLASWWQIWSSEFNKTLSNDFLRRFITAAKQDSSDAPRIVTNSKTFLIVNNGSPFIDGVVNVSQVRSLVGVYNEYTGPGTAASYTNPFFYADISDSGIDAQGEIILFDTKASDALIFDTGKLNVKSIERISTEYKRVYKNSAFTNGIHTRSLSDPESFAVGNGSVNPSQARENFITLVKTGMTANVPYGLWDFEKGSVTISNEGRTATIDMGDAGFNGLADISINIETDNLTPRTKTLVKNGSKIVNIQLADYDYSIGKADIAAYGGVYTLADASKFKGTYSNVITYDYGDIVVEDGVAFESIDFGANKSLGFANSWSVIQPIESGLFVLDNGQRDNFYDHGYIRYVGRSANLPGNVLVTFNYFEHVGEGPATVASYGTEFYDSIPTYRSVVNAKEYNLRDCLDFRPVRREDTQYQNFYPTIFPTASVNTEIDITYYLGRRDRLYVTGSLQNFESPYNRFYIEQGIPSDSPTEPLDRSDSTRMSLAILDLPPYTTSSFQVTIVYDDNTRFTMKDINRLENLVTSLDKVVKLHAMEIAVLQSTILNEDTGEILVKSGVLIEDFADLDTADLLGGQFLCLIDETERECFPAFNCFNMNLNIIADEDIKQFDDIITMPFTEEMFVSNLEGNSVINPNPAGIDDTVGRAVLSKKNSFLINLLLSAGNFLITSIGLKTLAAYASARLLSGTVIGGALGRFAGEAALFEAQVSENVLAVAWKAARDLFKPFEDSVNIIDSLTRFISKQFKGLVDIGRTVYEAFEGGFETLIDTFFGKSDIAQTATGGPLPGMFGDFTAKQSGTGILEIFNLGEYWSAVANPALKSAYAGLSQGIGQIMGGEFATGAGTIGNTITAFSSFIVGTAGALAATAVNAVAITLGYNAVFTGGLALAPGAAPTLAALAGAYAKGISAFAATGGTIGGVTIGATAATGIVIAGAIAVVYIGVKVADKLGKELKRWRRKISDERTKENIKFVRKDENTRLNVYSFNYKREFQKIAGYGKYEGYLASEVSKVYPDAVVKESNGYYSVDYSLIGK